MEEKNFKMFLKTLLLYADWTGWDVDYDDCFN